MTIEIETVLALFEPRIKAVGECIKYVDHSSTNQLLSVRDEVSTEGGHKYSDRSFLFSHVLKEGDLDSLRHEVDTPMTVFSCSERCPWKYNDILFRHPHSISKSILKKHGFPLYVCVSSFNLERNTLTSLTDEVILHSGYSAFDRDDTKGYVEKDGKRFLVLMSTEEEFSALRDMLLKNCGEADIIVYELYNGEGCIPCETCYVSTTVYFKFAEWPANRESFSSVLNAVELIVCDVVGSQATAITRLAKLQTQLCSNISSLLRVIDDSNNIIEHGEEFPVLMKKLWAFIRQSKKCLVLGSIEACAWDTAVNITGGPQTAVAKAEKEGSVSLMRFMCRCQSLVSRVQLCTTSNTTAVTAIKENFTAYKEYMREVEKEASTYKETTLQEIKQVPLEWAERMCSLDYKKATQQSMVKLENLQGKFNIVDMDRKKLQKDLKSKEEEIVLLKSNIRDLNARYVQLQQQSASALQQLKSDVLQSKHHYEHKLKQMETQHRQEIKLINKVTEHELEVQKGNLLSMPLEFRVSSSKSEMTKTPSPELGSPTPVPTGSFHASLSQPPSTANNVLVEKVEQLEFIINKLQYSNKVLQSKIQEVEDSKASLKSVSEENLNYCSLFTSKLCSFFEKCAFEYANNPKPENKARLLHSVVKSLKELDEEQALADGSKNMFKQKYSVLEGKIKDFYRQCRTVREAEFSVNNTPVKSPCRPTEIAKAATPSSKLFASPSPAPPPPPLIDFTFLQQAEFSPARSLSHQREKHNQRKRRMTDSLKATLVNQVKELP